MYVQSVLLETYNEQKAILNRILEPTSYRK